MSSDCCYTGKFFMKFINLSNDLGSLLNDPDVL